MAQLPWRRLALQFAALFILLVGVISSADAQAIICPSDVTFCTYNVESQTVVAQMTCGSFGSVQNLTATCNDTRVFNQVTITNATVQNIQAGAFAGLQIASLTLSNLGITSLDPASFTSLGSTLQTLSLDNNLLTSLPANVFSSLVSLTYLSLHNNALTGMPIGVFSSLTSLTYLYLGNNFIASLDPSAFAATTPLLQLELQNNSIALIPSNVFSRLNKLNSLRLDHNQISSLSGNTFTNLAQLVTVNISFNSITSLPGAIFTSNANLVTIDASHNAINSLDINFITGCANVFTLLLNDNEITTLPSDIFTGLNSISVLNLTNNSLTNIYSDTLTGMPFLTQLYLRNNYITALPVGIFDAVGALTIFDLSNNQLSTIALQPFTAAIALQTIDFSDNLLTHIRQDFFITQSKLTTLLLGNNQITTIDAGTFNTTPALQTLDLSYNNLSVDSLDGVFTAAGPTSLQTLRLSGNPITTVRDSTFSNLQQLTTLYLDHACLNNVSFGAALAIQQLYLSHNFISRIQAAGFTGLAQLTTLDLGSNNLATIDAGAIAILRLQLLNLTANSLDNNDVMTSSPAIVSSSTPCTVDLSWNLITSLAGLQRFTTVYLAGNPLACSAGGCLDRLAWLQPSNGSSIEPVWADFSVTTCSSNNAQQMFVSCYFSNSTLCLPSANYTMSFSAVAANYCAGVNQTSLLPPVKPSRILDQQRCGVYAAPTTPSYVSSTNSLSTPTLTDLVVTSTNWSLTAKWNLQGSVTTINGIEVTVDDTTPSTGSGAGSSTVATPTTEFDTQVSNTARSLTFTLPSGGCYLVCVRTVPNNPATTTPFATTTVSSSSTSPSASLSSSSTITTTSSAAAAASTTTAGTTSTTSTTTSPTPAATTTTATTTPTASTTTTPSLGTTLCANITVLPLTCDNTTRDWIQCTPPTAAPTSTPDWLIIAIVVGAGGGLLLILLIIIIVACIQCRRNKVKDSKGPEVAPGPVNLRPSESMAERAVELGRDFRGTLPEQSTVCVDYFDTNSRY